MFVYGRRVRGTYVDDLKAFLEELFGFIWEVVPNPVLGGAVGLVNMHSFSWPAELGRSVAAVRGCTTNCVVEDENAGCSSAAP